MQAFPPIQKWVDRLFKSSDLSKKTTQQLADREGLAVAGRDQDGEILAPKDFPLSGTDVTFLKFWYETFIDDPTDKARRYKVYELMDNNSADVQLVLDTYRDEALSVGFVDTPLKYSIKGDSKDLIEEILYNNKILTNIRSDMRSLCKYGDLFRRIKPSDNIKDASSYRIFNMEPSSVDIIYLKDIKQKVGYRITPDSKSTKKMKVYSDGKVVNHYNVHPWEISQSSIVDEAFYPYGKGISERIRVPYDQLITMEALYAVCRANRIERIVIRVPTGSNNAATAFKKLQDLRSFFKSVVLGQGGNRFSLNKEMGLTQFLWMPSDDNYQIDKMASSIDVSSDEDVRYFYEKFIAASRLPKGLFLADDTTDRGNSLQVQDVKFSRALIGCQTAYVDGFIDTCTTLGMMLGDYGVEVEAELLRPNQMSDQLIKRFSDQIDLAEKYMNLSQQFNGEIKTDKDGNQVVKPNPERYARILKKFGVPEDVVDLLSENDKTYSNYNSVYKSCSSKIPLLEKRKKEIKETYEPATQPKVRSKYTPVVKVIHG